MSQPAYAMQPPAQEPDLDSYTDMSVGEILRRTREYYGQSIEQVEINLRIRASQLIALEEGHLEQIPGRVYAIGFVRAYSEYLGLDGDKMVHLFKAQSVGKRVKPDLHFPVAVDESRVPSLNIILFSLVALILLIAYWSIFHTPTQHVEKIPPVPEALKASNLSLAPPTVAEEPPASLLDRVSGKSQMELVISEDSWIEIKNTEGKVLVEQVLKPGDKYIVPEDQDLVLSTGNAGGITVFIDGKKVDKLGETSQVKRDVLLKPETFSEKN
jgi:cytoskeletal protein RodZ